MFCVTLLAFQLQFCIVTPTPEPKPDYPPVLNERAKEIPVIFHFFPPQESSNEQS